MYLQNHFRSKCRMKCQRKNRRERRKREVLISLRVAVGVLDEPLEGFVDIIFVLRRDGVTTHLTSLDGVQLPSE